jgi:DNA repair exonuclease SbcCD ATPase subunit
VWVDADSTTALVKLESVLCSVPAKTAAQAQDKTDTWLKPFEAEITALILTGMTADPEALSAARASYTEQQAALAQLTEDVHGASVRKARVDSSLAASTTRLSELTKALADSVVGDSAYATATSSLEQRVRINQNIAAGIALRGDHRRRLEDLAVAMERTQSRLARGLALRNFAAKLERIKAVFHRQALPQMVAESNLQDMEADINVGLKHFGDPFWVETAAALSFTVHFPGEAPQPAERLSGGQKAVLATAFRSGLCRLFDVDLGMMTLDEPTTFMDEANVLHLRDALIAYAQQIRGNRQVIVVTHERDLRPAFDTVIDLSAAQA